MDDLGEAVIELLRFGGRVVEGGGVVCGGSEREEDRGEEGSLFCEGRDASGKDAEEIGGAGEVESEGIGCGDEANVEPATVCDIFWVGWGDGEVWVEKA